MSSRLKLCQFFLFWSALFPTLFNLFFSVCLLSAFLKLVFRMLLFGSFC